MVFSSEEGVQSLRLLECYLRRSGSVEPEILFPDLNRRVGAFHPNCLAEDVEDNRPVGTASRPHHPELDNVTYVEDFRCPEQNTVGGKIDAHSLAAVRDGPAANDTELEFRANRIACFAASVHESVRRSRAARKRHACFYV